MKHKWPTLEGRLSQPITSKGEALRQMKANDDILTPLTEKELQKYERKRYFVYVLLCYDNTLYTGWTTDLIMRLGKHNSGKGAKYTRSRTPVCIVYSEEYKSKSDAMKEEYRIKQLSRQEKIKLCHLEGML